MKKLVMTMSIAAAATLSGCGGDNDYTPAAGATGEQIFKAACMECHQAIEKDKDIFFELAQENLNAAYISTRVSEGGFMMPKFPNIKDAELAALSEYVVAHSKAK